MPIDLTIDVTEAVGVGEVLHTRATVVLPDPDTLADPPVVCFGFPGFGYSRGYFTFDMPGSHDAGEAGWHAARGWIFVACDHLCVGESASPSDAGALTLEHLAAANHATVTEVLRLLADGVLSDDFPPVVAPLTFGVGQSMGGGFIVVQQAHHATFDAIGVLGFSSIQAVLWTPPGTPDSGVTYMIRTTRSVVASSGSKGLGLFVASDDPELPAMARGFHYDDVPRDIVRADVIDYPKRQGHVPPWGSATGPPCSVELISPGVLAAEAAVIGVPVFVGVGERDMVPTPREEPRAYQRSPDITIAIFPRMAHMHNMASTREQLWRRLHAWGEGVAASR